MNRRHRYFNLAAAAMALLALAMPRALGGEGHPAGGPRRRCRSPHGGGVVWPHFWAIQIWLIVLLLVYSTMQELVSALARDGVRDLFLGPSRKNASAAADLKK